MIAVKVDTKELQVKLDALAGHLSGPQMGRAIALGINQTLGTRSGGARTQADREIRKVFNLRQKDVLRQIKTKPANMRSLVGDVLFSNAAIPMSQFTGTTGGRRKRGRGKATPITVEIRKGFPIVFNGGFFLKTKFGKGSIMIMHRSNAVDNKSYSTSFQFRHKRVNKTGNDLQIGAIFSPSPFGAEMNTAVKGVMRIYVETNLQKNVFRTLQAMADGHIRDANRRGRFRY